MDDPEKRETAEPALISSYRRFWAGSGTWEPWILPGWKQYNYAHDTKALPGVYEFGLSMSRCYTRTTTVVPLYVGMSTNVQKRHSSYLADGSHLAELMQKSSQDGYTIWRRIRYLDTKLQAERWEARFLTQYDYAWNAQLNPPKRNMDLVEHHCCCCPIGIDVVTRELGNNRQNGTSVSSLLSTPMKKSVFYVIMVGIALQIILSIAIICITSEQLTARYIADNGETIISECFLGLNSNGNSLCTYTYVVSGN